MFNISQTINAARQEGKNKSGSATEAPNTRSETPGCFDSRDEIFSTSGAVELFRIFASAFHNTARLILGVSRHSLNNHSRLRERVAVWDGTLRLLLSNETFVGIVFHEAW